jgi:hypothetical protein
MPYFFLSKWAWLISKKKRKEIKKDSYNPRNISLGLLFYTTKIIIVELFVIKFSL